jgi:hypothetical protein
MKFDIQFQRYGTIWDKFVVNATESGIVGVYHDGVPHMPDTSQVAAGMTAQYRKAIARAAWVDFGLSNTLKMPLYRKRDGAPLGTIYATLRGELA